MNMFGLVSLILVIAIAAWWLTGFGGVTPSSHQQASTSTKESLGAEYMMEDPFMNNPRPNYGEAVGGARGAADTIGQ